MLGARHDAVVEQGYGMVGLPRVGDEVRGHFMEGSVGRSSSARSYNKENTRR